MSFLRASDMMADLSKYCGPLCAFPSENLSTESTKEAETVVQQGPRSLQSSGVRDRTKPVPRVTFWLFWCSRSNFDDQRASEVGPTPSGC